jgi:hypothetical protein
MSRLESFFVVMTSVFLTFGALPLSTSFHGAIEGVVHRSLCFGPGHFGVFARFSVTLQSARDLVEGGLKRAALVRIDHLDESHLPTYPRFEPRVADAVL